MKLEPDMQRASVSQRTLPREGGQQGPSAPCALTQCWDTEWGQKGALPASPPLPQDNSADHSQDITLGCSPIPAWLPQNSGTSS